ncbi:ABC transporter ATP-binding protein [Novosphingobium endophyticum]|uniref:ABC transporter ATP-binding protein n=1 Tax=Novosphingobium endophyticum TaxID=1955250 RepID=A0A916TPM3_9SPHN|nr:ABC transporter ATP-binding protein [Novosphingobium endophyticum]GGB89528.1 ABC transporter ATP-binding protein [Novosphingobium endophyticum]
MAEAGETGRGARIAALRDLRVLLDIVPAAKRAAPLLVGLGVIASLAETAGISLIIIFLYAALGQLDDPGAIARDFGHAATSVLQTLGGPAQLAAAIFGLIVLRGIIGYIYSRISLSLGARISEIARNFIHGRYLDVSYDFVRRHKQAELMEILGTDSWTVATAYNAFTRLIINVCAIAVFAVVLLLLSWKITLIAILCAGLVSLFLARLSRPVTQLGASVKAEHQSMGGLMLMTLQGMRAIRAYGRERAQHATFLKSSASARHSLTRMERLSAAINPATEIGYLAIICLIVGGAGVLEVDFHATLTIVALLYRLRPHLQEFESNSLFLAQSAPQLRAVRNMIDPEGKTFPEPGTLAMPDDYERIAFRNVAFAYDGKQALDDVSFDIPRGQITALVGASGSGKTTIVNLLLRLYTPESGQILIGDGDIANIRRDEWLQTIAVAGQDIDLVEGTVRDNVLMARPDADQAALADAYRMSGLTDLLAGLEYGDKDWIGQQGLNLSGGERQRVGIARAILRDPGILILDEATSALDTALEARIRKVLEERFAGRTVLIITHRLETVRHVDHVIRMSEGKVLAEGPPAEVLAPLSGPSLAAMG